ncbi:MAG: hypothetical protein EA389_11130 [Ilumatobacter sp.]|nr:MAG: hypothetical protein EA389_11130 [Ilumatobacter sp.]
MRLTFAQVIDDMSVRTVGGTRSRRLAVGTLAGLLLVSCSSDDAAEPAAETATSTTSASIPPTTATTAITTTTGVLGDVATEETGTTGPPGGSGITSTTIDDGDDPESTDPESTDPESAGDGADLGAASCLVGSWRLNGAQWVANAGSARYVSGSYVYTFSDDGTFSVAVNDFNIIIDDEDGPVRVASSGSEQGTWDVFSDPVEAAIMFEIGDPPDLPHVFVVTTSVSVSETGYYRDEIIPLGAVDQNQGLTGIGPIDCDAETMVIRGRVPYPFNRI